MKPQWGLFIFLSLIVMAIFLGLGGAWLLPMLGVTGAPARAIGAGLGGAIVAILYFRLIRKPDGA